MTDGLGPAEWLGRVAAQPWEPPECWETYRRALRAPRERPTKVAALQEPVRASCSPAVALRLRFVVLSTVVAEKGL